MDNKTKSVEQAWNMAILSINAVEYKLVDGPIDAVDRAYMQHFAEQRKKLSDLLSDYKQKKTEINQFSQPAEINDESEY